MSAESKCHVFVVGLNVEEPQTASADSFEALKDIAYDMIIKMESGWCWFVIDGVKCYVSEPVQRFYVKLPNGDQVNISPENDIKFDADGRFTVLRP